MESLSHVNAPEVSTKAVFISEHNETQKYNSTLLNFSNVSAEDCVKSKGLFVSESNMRNIVPSSSSSFNKLELLSGPVFHSLNSSGERCIKSNFYEKCKPSYHIKEPESQNMALLNNGPYEEQVACNDGQECEGMLEKCNDIHVKPSTNAIDILSQNKENDFYEVLSNSQLDLHSNYSFTGHSYEAGIISFSDNMLWPSNLNVEEGGGEESASDFDLGNNFSVDDKDFGHMKYQVGETLQNFDITLDTNERCECSEISVQIDNSSQVNNNVMLLEKNSETSHLTQMGTYLENCADEQNMVKEWNGNVHSRRLNNKERKGPKSVSDLEIVDEIGVDIDSFECCGYSIDFKTENMCNVNASCKQYETLEENHGDGNKAASASVLFSKTICSNKDQNKEEHINTRIRLIVNALKYGSVRDGIKPSKAKQLFTSESSNCKTSNSGNKRNTSGIERNIKYGDHNPPNERHVNTISSESRQNYSVT